jgi:hypothetical protein
MGFLKKFEKAGRDQIILIMSTPREEERQHHN